MACGLYGKPLGFNPMLTPASEIFSVFPNGPQVTMKLKVKEIGPVNKQQTQYGARQHCIYTLTGQDEAIPIRADCWQDHIQTCLTALPVGAMFSISFCPKPLPQQLIAPVIPWGIRLNTECQIADIQGDGITPQSFNGQGFYGQQNRAQTQQYPAGQYPTSFQPIQQQFIRPQSLPALGVDGIPPTNAPLAQSPPAQLETHSESAE
uniref:Uncharacterized protein n=1 Tax=Panagrolaimus sp. PS1159 TaxID=55785 RepID=A0AC35F339_9BILA